MGNSKGRRLGLIPTRVNPRPVGLARVRVSPLTLKPKKCVGGSVMYLVEEPRLPDSVGHRGARQHVSWAVGLTRLFTLRDGICLCERWGLFALNMWWRVTYLVEESRLPDSVGPRSARQHVARVVGRLGGEEAHGTLERVVAGGGGGGLRRRLGHVRQPVEALLDTVLVVDGELKTRQEQKETECKQRRPVKAVLDAILVCDGELKGRHHTKTGSALVRTDVTAQDCAHTDIHIFRRLYVCIYVYIHTYIYTYTFPHIHKVNPVQPECIYPPAVSTTCTSPRRAASHTRTHVCLKTHRLVYI